MTASSIRTKHSFQVAQEKSRNRPGLFSKLAWGGWLCRLPQLDRISLRVAQAAMKNGWSARKAVPQGLTKSGETPLTTFGRFDARLVCR